MKVGLLLSEQLQQPEKGGGFTFEQEILDALLRLRSESPHSFYLLGRDREKPAFLSSCDLPWVTISPPPPPPLPPPPPPPQPSPPPPPWPIRIGRGLKRLFDVAADRGESVVAEPPPETPDPVEPIITKAVEEQVIEEPVAPSRPTLDYEVSPELKEAGLELICYLNPWVRPFLDIPYILNFWDLAHRTYPFFPEVSAAGEWDHRESIFRVRLQQAAFVITPNLAGSREIVSFYQVPEARIRTLHHPTPSFALRAAAQPADHRSLEHLGIVRDFLLYPAQFWPHKNHTVLLRALKLLKEKTGYAPQLVLTGSDKPLFNYAERGNEAFIRKRVADWSLQDQVIFAGFVTREDLIALYRQAIALVYPSFFGPENLPPLEAFALGCPVVASQIPGAEEQFADAALKADPLNPEAWVESIERVFKNTQLRASLVAKGKERAAMFTSENFVQGLFQIIDEFATYRCNWPDSLL